MKYKFTYQTTAFDLWQLSMYGTYSSMVGVCNIIFTVAIILLTAKFWGEVNVFMKILLIMGICLFTVIQPIAVYIRAKKQLPAIMQDIDIAFDDKGIHIKTDNQSSDLKWSKVKSISKKPSMIVIFLQARHGFILNNKVLGNQKEGLYNYVVSKIRK